MRRFARFVVYFLAALLLILLIGPFLLPVRPLTDLQPPAALAGADSRFVTIPFAGTDGIDLHYQEAGQGEPAFLLLHGFAANLYSWDRVAGDLAQYGRTVRYDRIPFGLSERLTPADWQAANPYTPDAALAQLVAFMDATGLERAIVVGNSAGGTLAVGLALAHPERVDGLILVSPAIYTSGGTPAALRPLLNTPQLARLGPLIARRFARFAAEGLAALAYHDPANISDAEMAAAAVSIRVENWDRAFWEFTAASRQLNYGDRLAELTLPVLVVTGDDDRVVPTAESIRLAGELPTATLVVIPACGHVAHQECDRAFMTAVDQYLTSLEQP